MTPDESPTDDAEDSPGIGPESGDKDRRNSIERRFFGSPQPVAYRGTVDGHEVLVEIRHSVLDTTLARMWVDGTPAVQHSENDAARKKTRKRLAAFDKKEAKEGSLDENDEIARQLDEDSGDHPWHGVFDAKMFVFRISQPDDGSDSAEGEDAENQAKRKEGKKYTIRVKLRSFGKTAEVTTFGGKPQFFVPETGSASAARDAKQLANPRKFALRSAGIKAVAILVGLGVAWLAGIILSWLVGKLSPLIPDVSLPSIDIPFPEISLPSINLPRINLPALPGWIEPIEPFIQPAILIIIAGLIGLAFAKRKQKALADRETKDNSSGDAGSGDTPSPTNR